MFNFIRRADLPTFTHFTCFSHIFFWITYHARIQAWWLVSRILGKFFILSEAIIISYSANLATPAAIVQTTIELNPWMKHEHPTYEDIFSRTRSAISWLDKHDWNSKKKKKKNPTSFHWSQIVSYIRVFIDHKLCHIFEWSNLQQMVYIATSFTPRAICQEINYNWKPAARDRVNEKIN